MSFLPQSVIDRIVDWGARAAGAWDVVSSAARAFFAKVQHLAVVSWDGVSLAFSKISEFVNAHTLGIEIALAVLFVVVLLLIVRKGGWKAAYESKRLALIECFGQIVRAIIDKSVFQAIVAAVRIVLITLSLLFPGAPPGGGGPPPPPPSESSTPL